MYIGTYSSAKFEFQTLSEYQGNKRLSTVLVDAQVVGRTKALESSILSFFQVPVDIALLDNSDLYLTGNLLRAIKEKSKMILISAHRLKNICYGKMDRYWVHFDNNSLRVEEW